jgi:hypothetical protein
VFFVYVRERENQGEDFTYWETTWFTAVAMTTLGFGTALLLTERLELPTSFPPFVGDLIPQDPVGRLFAIFACLQGVLLTSLTVENRAFIAL